MIKADVPRTQDITFWSEKLSDAADEAVHNFSNETELREHIHQTILDAMQSLYALDWSNSTGETNTRSTGPRSPMDRRYGGVVVEWEWQMSKARREHGSEQALNYLKNIRAKHSVEEAFTAVVSDGKQWGFLHYDPEVTATDGLFAPPEPATCAEHFTWVDNSPGACRKFLELIGDYQRSPIDSRSLTSLFGPSSEIASRLVTILSQSAAGRLDSDRTDTLYREWHRAMEVVYEDLEDDNSALAISIQSAYRMSIRRPLGESLFVLHTYFALVGRILAVELLAISVGERDDAPTSWQALSDVDLLSRLKGLENGHLPGDLEISNLFEADLFSWWTDRAEYNTTLLDALRDLIGEISRLAFPRIAFGPRLGGDVLRDLYQSLVPNVLRKALGEFLTPHWLAEACLSRMQEIGAETADGRVLDPTCGTGTFITPILAQRLARLTRRHGHDVSVEQVQGVLDSVAGIDLNPVAVTATRVNFVLLLGDLSSVGSLTIPVWRADSLIVPESAERTSQIGPIAGIVHRRLETSLDDPFTIPASLDTGAKIAALRDLIEDHISGVMSDPDDKDVASEAARAFADDFTDKFGPNSDSSLVGFNFDDELKVASNLFAQVLHLAQQGRNGVWARLIENAYAPIFAGKFDVVIGNPPWLTWTKLPAGWRKKSEPLWRRTGLWFTPEESGDTFSLQSSDMATLVFAVSLLRYCADGGVVGLLVPNALINADPGSRAFRQFHLRPHKRDAGLYDDVDIPFAALHVDDWSAIQPFAPDAANKPVFMITKKGAVQNYPVSASLWRRQPGAKIDKSSWQNTRPQLLEASGSFDPVDPSTKTSAWRFQDHSKPKLITGGTNSYTFGKGLDTRGANGVFFVDVDRYKSLSSANKKATIRIRNLVSEGRNKTVTEQVGDVEAELVYPLLRGRDVQPWTARPVEYFVLPHYPDEKDLVLSAKDLRTEYPKALSWLRRNRPALLERKAPPTRSWDMSATGDDWVRVDGPLKHMQSGYPVVVRELSQRPAAALVERKFDSNLHREVSALIDHKLMLCTVQTRREALYLVGMINSTPIQDLLESFVNATSVSPKSLKRLPIPTFSSDDSDMAALVDCADLIVRDADPQDKAAELQGNMDAAVLRIVAAAPDYVPQPKRARSKAARSSPAVQEAFDLFARSEE